MESPLRFAEGNLLPDAIRSRSLTHCSRGSTATFRPSSRHDSRLKWVSLRSYCGSAECHELNAYAPTMGSELGASPALGEYLLRTGRQSFLVLVSVFGAILGLLSIWVPIPVWIWLTVLCFGVLLAQFQAFAAVLSERDEERRRIHDLENGVRFHFNLVGLAVAFDGRHEAGGVVSHHDLGFELMFRNAYRTPIWFEVEHLAVEVAGVPSGTELSNTGSIVLPGADARFFTPAVERVPAAPTLAGEVDLRVRYGVPDAEAQYRLTRKVRIVVIPGANGVHLQHRWLDEETHDRVTAETETSS